jgi:hypothetical protein
MDTVQKYSLVGATPFEEILKLWIPRGSYFRNTNTASLHILGYFAIYQDAMPSRLVGRKCAPTTNKARLHRVSHS